MLLPAILGTVGALSIGAASASADCVNDHACFYRFSDFQGSPVITVNNSPDQEWLEIAPGYPGVSFDSMRNKFDHRKVKAAIKTGGQIDFIRCIPAGGNRDDFGVQVTWYFVGQVGSTC